VRKEIDVTAECPREQDTISAVVHGRWPDACDASLQAHAKACATCAALIQLMTLLRADRDDMRNHVSVPSAGQVWWRSAVRARVEDTQVAGRPLSWLFGAIGACAIGLCVAVMGLFWPQASDALAWVAAHTWHPAVSQGDWTTMFAGLARASGLLVLGAAAFLVLAPLALYLTLSDD
jgi:hypothetical protein